MEHMKDIEITRSHFVGQAVARCTKCGWTCVYWEDPQELEHECLTEEEETETGACDFCDYCCDPADITFIRYRYTVGPNRSTRVEGNACPSCRAVTEISDGIEMLEGMAVNCVACSQDIPDTQVLQQELELCDTCDTAKNRAAFFGEVTA